MKTWVTPAKELIPLRDEALKLSMDSGREQWLIFHWAMTSMTYPFWYKVAEQEGKLLKLQPANNQAQIHALLHCFWKQPCILYPMARQVWGILESQILNQGSYMTLG